MKNFIIIILFTFFGSCNYTATTNIPPASNDKPWEIKLANNLGTVKIVLPKHLDTLFSWTQYSDCGDGCALLDYRIQPKVLPIFKDNGFMYFPLKDSVEQFTIKHSKLNYAWQMADTSLVPFLMAKLKSEAAKYPSDNYLIDTVIEIDNRLLPVIAFATFDTVNKTTTQYLNTAIPLKENLLRLFFEYRKNYNDTSSKTFIKYSFEALKKLQVGGIR
jgi:hypothetical protein